MKSVQTKGNIPQSLILSVRNLQCVMSRQFEAHTKRGTLIREMYYCLRDMTQAVTSLQS
jgi:hypothetical protein